MHPLFLSCWFSLKNELHQSPLGIKAITVSWTFGYAPGSNDSQKIVGSKRYPMDLLQSHGCLSNESFHTLEGLAFRHLSVNLC